MNYDFGTICESAIIDQKTNHLSLIQIVEGFNIPKLPGIMPRIYLVSSWSKLHDSKKSESSKARVSLVDPEQQENNKIPNFEFDVVIPADKKRLRTILEISGLHLEKAGEHKFLVERKVNKTWEELGSISFDVTQNLGPEETIGLPK